MTMLMEQALGKAGNFDVIHSHLDFLGFPLARRNPIPTVTTFHGRLDLPELQPVFREYAEMPMVSISNAQRKPVSGANWQATVFTGYPRICMECGHRRDRRKPRERKSQKMEEL